MSSLHPIITTKADKCVCIQLHWYPVLLTHLVRGLKNALWSYQQIAFIRSVYFESGESFEMGSKKRCRFVVCLHMLGKSGKN